MKKLLTMAIALMLALILALPALADVPYNGPLPLYVNREKIKVYREQSTKAKYYTKLKGATAVMPELVSDDGLWYGILVEDTKHGGQKIGWVQAEVLVDYFPQSLCPHNWSDWTVERQPTCTEKGYRWRTCLICGIRDESEPKKKDHEWGKWKVLKEATCSKKGERVRTCKNCGTEDREEYYDDHDFDSWQMTKEPTCTEMGERQHTCRVCGTVKTQALDMLPHDYEYQVTVEATDHSAGVRSKICKVCGANGGEETFDPEGTIRRGDRGDNVAAMQQLLVEQGYLNAGGADGIFGGGTEKALMKYQQDRNLNPDGVAWPQTLVDLEHDYGPWTTVQEMTRTQAGERVRVCQGCGFEQRETIDAGTMFEKGRRGEDVRAMQQIIKEVGYDAGSFDGIYGGKLDNALAGFAADHGIVVETGKVRPADVDAVVNAWFDTFPEETWKGETTMETPVNLALTVEPVGAADDAGITTYNWSLTNLGSEPATFTALLLTFGEPDFRHENLVMALNGIDLEPGAGNSATGSFNADADWGEGNLNFAALAVSQADGSKWLSNTVTVENAAHPAQKTVAPVATPLDLTNLPDGTYPVSFNRGDVLSGSTGIFMNAVHVYTQDWYDIVDINTLKAGDTIIVEGEPVPVLSVEQDEYGFAVNEGQEGVRSFYLSGEEDSNGFAVHGLDDLSTYTDQGETTLLVDAAATFTDSWDIESKPVTVTGDAIVEAMQASANEYFVAENTTVRLEGGKVVEINRTYVP